jgi:superfamily II DNA or RNA helicase
MKLLFDSSSMESYRKFIRLKSIPKYEWNGRVAIVPDEYASMFDAQPEQKRSDKYKPSKFLFDYQRDIARMAIEKQKFSVFAECGLGKTLILLEFAKHTASLGIKTLIVSPLMVVSQTLSEAARFYPKLDIGQVKAANLQYWLNSTDSKDTLIGVTNYEAIREGLEQGKLGALVLDESSMLKSHYGAWGTRLIDLGKGLHWKACFTGTPAPNDQIEYANHAVFMDHKKTVNEFLARYFINRGQTDNRWELKKHAMGHFYRDLSHWCIFLNNPATYGWKDNCETIPPINVHIDRVELTDQQRKLAQNVTGDLFANNIGGIGQRGKLSQIAKGKGGIETLKPEFIRSLVESWPDESTIIWCHYNEEQDSMERAFPNAASIRGETDVDERVRLIEEFKAGRIKQLISKPKILGFGLNLQIATRQVFSGLQDSYEEYWQAVKRSNRIGSTKPLNVHIPVTELEEPMIMNVLRKARRVQQDSEEQERIFRQNRLNVETLQ